ncbi:unnamed protein product [Rhizoctonia solani]|uniref:Uncharacterized protein n=1 Tax=Rhizoctonia solani TaxID=456999 RepID=A0A8H3HLI9_9AGAM|nr:unnamed protein product [Rhizoctonia solani]CAE6518388.1 unnamed protein product [Rhizoctonia solani]
MMFDFANPPFDGTQTESESEDESRHDIQITSPSIRKYGSDGLLPLNPQPVERSESEMCLASVKFLTDLSDEDARDPSTHAHISEAVDYIMTFVDTVLLWERLAKGSFASIDGLFSPSFLVRLFSLRDVFRGLAANELAWSEGDITVICWADDLIVKLCACILHLATNGQMRDIHKISGIQSIKVMQDNEARRSATQLPVHFERLVDLLSSKNASPATARIALTVLYGVHVLREQYHDSRLAEIKLAIPYSGLIGYRPMDSNVSGLASSVSKHIAKYAAADSSPTTIYPSVLAEYAMVASLYVHCSLKINNPLDAPFVPHHEHILVNLINSILDHCSSEPTGGPSTGPLIMLLNDPGVMRWFWERWGDGSTSAASTALRLTREWVQRYGHHENEYHRTQFDILWATAPYSFQALLHIVGVPSIAPADPLSETAIIERVCDAYIQLAKGVEPENRRYNDIFAGACKKICPYILVPDNNEHTGNSRELIVAFLIAIGPDVLKVAYGNAAAVEFRWNNRGIVEQVLQTIAGMINSSSEGGPDVQVRWTERETLRMKHLLDVLVVFLHAKTCAASAIIASTTFMSALIPWASRQPDKRPVADATQWNLLRTSALMVLGLAYSHSRICCSVLTKRFPEFDLDAFVNTILDSDRLTLLEICGLARYIIATEEDRILDDPVTVLEMWSCIQDAMLSTLQRRFLGDEEAVSVAVSGTLCMSLLSILRSTGKQTKATILASPWTQTLRDELRRTLSRETPDDHTLGLCRQLESAGTAVIQMIGQSAELLTVEDSVRLVCAPVGGGWLHIVPMFV